MKDLLRYDVIASIPPSSNESESSGVIAFYPKQMKGQSGKWFETWLNKGGKDYLMLNATKPSDRNAIAEFHGLLDKWNNWTANNKNASEAEHMYTLVKFVSAKRQNEQNDIDDVNVTFSFEEGMHRYKAMIHVFFNARVDKVSPEVVCNTLSITEMKSVIDQQHDNVEEPSIDRNNFVTNHNAIMRALAEKSTKKTSPQKGSKNLELPMLRSNIHLTVDAVNRQKVDAKEIANACVTVSRAISQAKLKSARVGAFGTVADILRNFVSGVTDDNILHEPNVGGLSLLHEPNVSNENDAANDDDEAVSTEHTTSKEFTDYIADPFDGVKYRALLQSLKTRPFAEDDEEEAMDYLLPPFVPSFNSQAELISREDSARTPRSWNEILLIPPLVYIILGGARSVSANEMTNDEHARRAIWYLIDNKTIPIDRYSENDMDVKETAAYDLPSGKHPHRITTEPNHALGAVMTIIDICNACLIQLRQNAKDLDQHQRQDEVKRMSSFLYAVFKAVEDSPCPYDQKVRTVGKFNQMAVHCFLYR